MPTVPALQNASADGLPVSTERLAGPQAPLMREEQYALVPPLAPMQPQVQGTVDVPEDTVPTVPPLHSSPVDGVVVTTVPLAGPQAPLAAATTSAVQ